MDNFMRLEILAVGENEGFARNAVAAFALCLNPSLSDLSDIKTVVSEAVTNCIVHAYAQSGGEENVIKIECRAEKRADGGVLHIAVSDGGCGIANVDKAMQPFYTTLENEERSGMGFTIMQTFMDGFTLDSQQGKGTRVSMFRRIQSEAIKEEMKKERVDA